jgi:hypothetical protein
MLPHSIKLQTGTVVINADPHTREGSHWLTIHFQRKSSTAFYFDSYGQPPSDSNIQAFIRRNCAVWGYNTSLLQGPTSVVCGHYCCLFALNMDRGFTPQQFVRFFTLGYADHQVNRMFADYFGPLCGTPTGGQCCVPSHN